MLANSLTAALDGQNPNQATIINSPNQSEVNQKIVIKEEDHQETNMYEPVTCDDCNEVTVPRHQINHHKNESCFAKEKSISEYSLNDTNELKECVKALIAKVAKLEKEKVDSDTLLTHLRRKADKKANDQLLYLLVNDFDAARDQINK